MINVLPLNPKRMKLSGTGKYFLGYFTRWELNKK